MAAECTLPWYVAHAKPRQEQIAKENLARQGYAVYLPKLKVLKNNRHRQEIRFEPMFPRYLFFQPGQSEQSIAPVRSTQGVASIVRFGGNPAVLKQEALENIRSLERCQNAADILELSQLRPGRTVVITRGPLNGLHGLVAMVSRQRVIVLMSLLGAETKVTLSYGELKLAA
jgi:transcriptional antiterminator RfaH